MAITLHETTEDEKDWVKYQNDQIKGVGKSLVDEADKYKDVFTGINTIYLALLVFFGLANDSVLKAFPFPVSLIFLVPIVFWIAGMYLFLMVKAPVFYECPPKSPSCIKEETINSNLRRGRYYKWGIFAFALGIIMMLVPLVAGSFLVATTSIPSTGEQVQFIVKGENAAFIQEIPLQLVPGTNKTSPVTLLAADTSAYTIRMENGNIVTIPKDWIISMIVIPK